MVKVFRSTTASIRNAILRGLPPITKRRMAKLVIVIGLTLAVLINSMVGINNTMKHRRLCAHVMSRHTGSHGNRRLQDEQLAGCDVYFPTGGTGPLVPWQTLFPPVASHILPGDDDEIAVDDPPGNVAYVVTYGGCPGGNKVGTEVEDGNAEITSQSQSTTDLELEPESTFNFNPISDGEAFTDTSAILKHSIACNIPSNNLSTSSSTSTTDSGTVTTTDVGAISPASDSTAPDVSTNPLPFDFTSDPPIIYAFIPSDGVHCVSETGVEYDRASVLQNLGYYVKVWDSPIDPSLINNLEPPNSIPESITDSDLTDLSKLQALSLENHEFVVLLDQGHILRKPLDDVFESLDTLSLDAAYVLDPATNTIDTSFLILRPNVDLLDQITAAYLTANYTDDGGWDNSGILDLGPGGILQHVLLDPTTPNGLELDRCTYANNGDSECSTVPFSDVIGFSFSEDICGEPWMCTFDTSGLSTEETSMCEERLKYWVDLRLDFAENDFNQELSTVDGEYHNEIYQGICSGAGPENYIPLLSVVPKVENCIDGSLIYGGCVETNNPNGHIMFGNGDTRLELTVDYPPQCEVFYPDSPSTGGASSFVEVDLKGSANIAGSGISDTSMIFVLDRSGSTCDNVGLGCSSDENFDLQHDDVLDCEILAILGMVERVRAEGTVSQVGLVSFSARLRTIVPATIELPLTDINDFDTNLMHAIEIAIRQIDCGGATNYAAGVEKACELVDSSTTDQNVVIFISDGVPTTGGSPAGYCNNKAVFHTIALGSSAACDIPNSDVSLLQISSITGGTCQEVVRIPDIRFILKELAEAQIIGVRGLSRSAGEGTVNFGCTDNVSFRNNFFMTCANLNIVPCDNALHEVQDQDGRTSNTECCVCGGGILLDSGPLQMTVNNALIDDQLKSATYEDVVELTPGRHKICTDVSALAVGVPSSLEICRDILVCNHAEDF